MHKSHTSRPKKWAAPMLIVLSIVTGLVRIPRAEAATFVVNSFNDGADKEPGDGKCATNSLPNLKCTLRAAIMEANFTPGGPHSIVLPAGTYTLVNLPEAPDQPTDQVGDLNIHNSMNIIASGGIAVIRGASGWPERIFNIVQFAGTNITVTMTGLDIGNGHASDGFTGGAIRIRSGTVTLTNVTVRDSSVDGTGGGGISNAGSLTLDHCTIKDNSTHFDGGGLLNSGSALVLSSSITGNTATDGGGIHNTGSLSVSRSNIDQNNANFAGGAIYNENNIALLNNVSMFSNVAQVGGGIANRTSAGIAATMVIDRTTFDSNIAFTGGGAIDNTSGLTVKNSTLSGNAAFGATGGGGIHNTGTATLNNATIASNGAGTGGGILNETGTVRFSNTILSGNSAPIGPDCSGPAALTSAGFNLILNISGCTILGVNSGNISVGTIIGQDPLLGPLQANGGFASTRALGPGSPAIDHGTATKIGPACEPIDERQVARPQDGDNDLLAVCDIGALEASPVGAFDLTPDNASVQAGEVFLINFRWTAPGSWRTLNTLELRLTGDDGPIFDLLWNQQTNAFELLEGPGNPVHPNGPPGSHAILEGKLARLILDGTNVQGSGPAGRDVTLTLALSLKTPSTGQDQRTYRIEVAATDDFGNAQALALAGVLTVAAKHQ